MTPSILLGNLSGGPSELAVLLFLIAATGTFVEYRTNYPTFVEFRDAPPINRIRFIALFAMVFFLAVLSKHTYQPTNLTRMVSGLGTVVGSFLDFPFSPVRMVLLMLPNETAPVIVHMVRAGAGLAYFFAMISVLVFFVVVRLNGWPVAHGAFNVWVNLPLFDPTAGRDVVERLNRDGWFNLLAGALLPFLVPAIVRVAELGLPAMNLSNPHVLTWTLAGWAFVPASMVMRGIALMRVAELIEEKRRRAYARADQMQAA